MYVIVLSALFRPSFRIHILLFSFAPEKKKKEVQNKNGSGRQGSCDLRTSVILQVERITKGEMNTPRHKRTFIPSSVPCSYNEKVIYTPLWVAWQGCRTSDRAVGGSVTVDAYGLSTYTSHSPRYILILTEPLTSSPPTLIHPFCLWTLIGGDKERGRGIDKATVDWLVVRLTSLIVRSMTRWVQWSGAR